MGEKNDQTVVVNRASVARPLKNVFLIAANAVEGLICKSQEKSLKVK